ncbi:hypothetical protein [Peribacillus asahii]|uniref:hypothetical protein n=1 Tax=Peribacillus asahii TaxID=228899 RepID=UPI00380A9B9C
MKTCIWEAPKQRQVSFLNHIFSWRRTRVDKHRYKMIMKIFKSNSGIILDDIESKARKRLILKTFFFKFEGSCSNAKYVRCGKKKGYENVEFKLGSWNRLIRNLQEHRPDLIEIGTNICRTYIEKGFNGDYAPILHRKSDKGDYAWDNIEIIARKEHDALTKQERQKKKELSTIN